MEKHGFQVEKHFLLDTAWRATFFHGTGGRTIGVNSEVYPLPHLRIHLIIEILAALDGRSERNWAWMWT